MDRKLYSKYYPQVTQQVLNLIKVARPAAAQSVIIIIFIVIFAIMGNDLLGPAMMSPPRSLAEVTVHSHVYVRGQRLAGGFSRVHPEEEGKDLEEIPKQLVDCVMCAAGLSRAVKCERKRVLVASISAAEAQRPQQCKFFELVRAKAGQLRRLALVHVNLPTKHIDFPTVPTHSLCEKPARLRGNKAKLLDANTHTSFTVIKVSSMLPSDFDEWFHVISLLIRDLTV
jgi:hypothetical protein